MFGQSTHICGCRQLICSVYLFCPERLSNDFRVSSRRLVLWRVSVGCRRRPVICCVHTWRRPAIAAPGTNTALMEMQAGTTNKSNDIAGQTGGGKILRQMQGVGQNKTVFTGLIKVQELGGVVVGWDKMSSSCEKNSPNFLKGIVKYIKFFSSFSIGTELQNKSMQRAATLYWLCLNICCRHPIVTLLACSSILPLCPTGFSLMN